MSIFLFVCVLILDPAAFPVDFLFVNSFIGNRGEWRGDSRQTLSQRGNVVVPYLDVLTSTDPKVP